MDGVGGGASYGCCVMGISRESQDVLVVFGDCCCMPFSTILVVNPGSPGLESSVLVTS